MYFNIIEGDNLYDTSVKSIKIRCKLACKRIYYLLTRKNMSK